MKYKLMNGDCLELMKSIPDGSVDLILTDPPYGTVKGLNIDGWKGDKTDWDNTLNWDSLWGDISRVLKPNGVILLFAQEPLTSSLITVKPPIIDFCQKLIWLKNHFGNPLIAKTAHVNMYEEIIVFNKNPRKNGNFGDHPLKEYFLKMRDVFNIKMKDVNNLLNNQMSGRYFTNGSAFRLPVKSAYDKLESFYNLKTWSEFLTHETIVKIDNNYKESKKDEDLKTFNLEGLKTKQNVLRFDKPSERYHPTQKPVDLLEYLIKTYTHENETVLDFTMGSGSTGVACLNANRNFIGIEMDDKYFQVAKERLNNEPYSNER